nr:MAG TPA: PD-(D/E)XK endonuclease [Caudoviricetes sp.]
MLCRNGCEDLIVRENYVITGSLYDEAVSYARKARAFTSNRHDFHPGGLSNKEKKMFEGKLGEKAIKILLTDNHISFIEDTSSYDERDEFDFLLVNENEQLKVDVKTRTEDFHIRTLEMVEQAENHPKDIYISVRLFRESNTVVILGWFSYKDLIRKGRIENQGYLDNYVMYDSDLRPILDLEKYVLTRFKKEK